AAWWLVLAPVYLTAVHGVLAGPVIDRLAVMPPLAALGGAAVAALVARTGGAAPPASAPGGPHGGSPKEKA
ncbi:MAG: hypothetical protein IMZ66_01925, partial [Planctomycetes bacterium]|nr:hypothetical protein [Planctomycetota bacterium]